jgi:hypothetical protein
MIRVHPEDLKANFRQIASYLDFVDILSCKSALNSILNEAIEDLLATFVTSLLHRWTEDPLGLRGIMHENRAVISGSSAVWLLDRFPSQWEPNDLDIYTPFSRARPFIEYFTSQGYNLFSQSKTKIQNPYNDDEEHRIIDLATVFKMERGHRRIDILESMTESAVRPISDFHTTLVMNYISAGTIHILYPRLFFEKKVFLNRAKYTSSNDYIEKYRKRGFEICGGNQVETKLLGGTCPYIERTSKDKHSTTLKISALSGENADRIIPSDNLPVLKWKFTNWDAHRSCNQDLCVVEQFVDAVCCNPIIEAMIKQACNTTYVGGLVPISAY